MYYQAKVQGTLSYSKNGRHWGVAFASEDLRKNDLYPAVAPIYSGDSFKLVRPAQED